LTGQRLLEVGEVRSEIGHELAFSPDGKLLVYCNSSSGGQNLPQVKVCDGKSGRLLRTVVLPVPGSLIATSFVRTHTVAVGGRFFRDPAVGNDFRGGTYLVNVESGEAVHEVFIQSDAVSGIAPFRNDSFVTCDWNGEVKLWNLPDHVKQKP
jgi:WD40 repeat protein